MQLLKRILPLFYFLIVSLPHHPFSNWFDTTVLFPSGHYSVQRYADVLSLLTILVAVALATKIVLVHQSQAIKHFGVLLLLLILMYVSDQYLIVNNIERIHYPQYAILALLLGLSLRGELLIFFTASFAGFLDEFLQYVMNPNRTNYLDFNDIALNVLGAGLGVVVLVGIREGAYTSASAYEQQFNFIFLSLLVALTGLVAFGLLTDRIVALVEKAKERSVFTVFNDRMSFVMSFEKHSEFWQKSYYGKGFHIFTPFEGLAVIALLSVATWRAVGWLNGKRDERKP